MLRVVLLGLPCQTCCTSVTVGVFQLFPSSAFVHFIVYTVHVGTISELAACIPLQAQVYCECYTSTLHQLSMPCDHVSVLGALL